VQHRPVHGSTAFRGALIAPLGIDLRCEAYPGRAEPASADSNCDREEDGCSGGGDASDEFGTW
jgi:hypothetical protein